MTIRKVLVTGGAGYIGTHSLVELLQAGYEVICADNFTNSSSQALKRVEIITEKPVETFDIDFCQKEQVQSLMRLQFDAVIHFAGHKAVGESVDNPLKYYHNNLLSLINLCEGLDMCGCKNLIFSSSAAVYDTATPPPYDEESPVAPSTPYGKTKAMAEDILKDLCASDSSWNISILRYFNPVGAHPSGLIGEDPNGIPNNLMPYIAQVAIGRLKELSIYGTDYDTPDGTCIRDFIHVVDLAQAHLAALRKLENALGFTIHNIGTGKGHSVMELVSAFEQVNKVKIPHILAPRRTGDMPINYAMTDKANKELEWTARLGLDHMVRDTWNWQVKNPNGYRSQD